MSWEEWDETHRAKGSGTLAKDALRKIKEKKLPPHLQKIVDSPKAQKIYKEAQYKAGIKHFGKEHTIKNMKEKYGKS